MKTITLLDTSAASDNLGDQIIVDAVTKQLGELLPDAYCYSVATHEYMSGHSKQLLRSSSAAFVAGTNILASNMEARVLWKLRPWDVPSFSNAVLVGCGWMNYMKAPNPYSRWLLRSVLSHEHIHAVRDSYTLQQLTGLEKRVLNTSCPTMWDLSPEHCARIPRQRSDEVVTTLTHYLGEPDTDRQLLRLLLKRYSTVHFWPQQREDMDYLLSLHVDGIQIVNPSLRAFDRLLEAENIEFLGTRLHGGIRALQKGRRALILSVDNRAKEISRDTGLPTVARNDFDGMGRWIDLDRPTIVTLPQQSIDTWRAQFY